MEFTRYIAIDWSGARNHGRGLAGVQVAMCMPGSTLPTLVANPAGGAWGRFEVADWLVGEARPGATLLIGMDFSFAFPYCDEGAYLPGMDAEQDQPSRLWRLVDDICGDQVDCYAGAFIEDARFADAFWHRGPQPRRFKPRYRLTERRCQEQGLGQPETVFKLIGSKQVGKGSLAGMRMLHHLTRNVKDTFKVWPFDAADDGANIFVEIFPRQYLRRGGLGNGKVRTLDALNRALRFYGSDPMPPSAEPINDHQADAFVSVVALRQLGAVDSVWHPSAMSACARRREGWIFGVE